MPSFVRFLLASTVGAVMAVQCSAFQTGSQGRVMWANNCDFYGSDIYSVRGIPDVCGDLCADASACTHWTWTNYNGGTCWLKSGSSGSQNTYYGAGCGYVIGRFSTSTSSGGSSSASNNGLSSAESQEMLNLINYYRATNGLAGLTIDAKLTAAAMVHSKDQANRCFMTHDGSDGSKAWNRMDAQGYDWSVAAENVAAGQTSVAQVMTAWWNSPGHRVNILKSNVKNVGFAKAVNSKCSNFATYWTQDFAQ